MHSSWHHGQQFIKKYAAELMFACPRAGGAVVFTNATGYAVANANFTLPGFYNVSATFPGNTTTTPTLNAVAAYAGCAQWLSASFPSCMHRDQPSGLVCIDMRPT